MTEDNNYEQKCKKITDLLDSQYTVISDLRVKNDKLREIKQGKTILIKKSPIQSEVSFIPVNQEEQNDSSFEDDINSILRSYMNLNEDFTDEEIEAVLPNSSNPRYRDILFRLAFESVKEIKDSKEIIRDSQLSDEEIKLWESIIKTEKRKIDYIKSCLIEKEGKEEINEVKENNKLILVPKTGSKNGKEERVESAIRLIDELEHIPSEYYNDFVELIRSIENGTFKNYKAFTNDNKLNGLSEVKLNKARVAFVRLKGNCYALISAFVKKCDNDKLYHDSLVIKYKSFLEIKESLIRNLDNNEFMKENDSNVEQLWNILSPKEEKKREIRV